MSTFNRYFVVSSSISGWQSLVNPENAKTFRSYH